jgi:hypothetical protein
LTTAPLGLLADFIVKMRVDLGLFKKNSLSSLDILRIFVTHFESRYDERQKKQGLGVNSFFRKSMNFTSKHDAIVGSENKRAILTTRETQPAPDKWDCRFAACAFYRLFLASSFLYFQA